MGGRSPRSPSRMRRRYRLYELGYVAQAFHLRAGGNVMENAASKLWLTKDVRRAERIVVPLLERLGLGDRLHSLPSELSMGERQRVMIARALSVKPKLVLADEPTGSLDTQRSREVLELLRELCRERQIAVLLVTHDPQAAAFADRALELRDGRLGLYVADRTRPGDAGRGLSGPGPLAMTTLSGILKKYRARLRVRSVLVQELLAVVGLAVGVALLFAAQIAGTSLNHGVTQLTHGLVGDMQLQLQARGPEGFPAQLLSDVRQIPGVAEAQPVLEEQANVVGPRGRSRWSCSGYRRALRSGSGIYGTCRGIPVSNSWPTSRSWDCRRRWRRRSVRVPRRCSRSK